MRGAKACPACGFLLRHEDPPVGYAEALRLVAFLLLPWIVTALFLAFLWAPTGENEVYGVAALAVLAGWLWLRPRVQARGKALLARRQYRCAQCGRRYTGADLTDGDA